LVYLSEPVVALKDYMPDGGFHGDAETISLNKPPCLRVAGAEKQLRDNRILARKPPKQAAAG